MLFVCLVWLRLGTGSLCTLCRNAFRAAARRLTAELWRPRETARKETAQRLDFMHLRGRYE